MNSQQSNTPLTDSADVAKITRASLAYRLKCGMPLQLAVSLPAKQLRLSKAMKK